MGKIMCFLGFHKLTLNSYIRTWICNVWGQGWEYFRCERCGKECDFLIDGKLGHSLLGYLTEKQFLDSLV